MPQKSVVKRSHEKPRNATSTINARMGTSFATVVTTFITAACFRPRVSPHRISQLIADTAIANTQRFCSTGT